MSKAGNFEIKIREPYPAWGELHYRGERLCSVHHSELSDLQYAVTKAMQEARAVLGKDANEV